MSRPRFIPITRTHCGWQARHGIRSRMPLGERWVGLRFRLTRCPFAGVAALVGLVLAACDSGTTRASNSTDPGAEASEPQPRDAELRLDLSYQRISGFGASSAWTAPAIDDGLADLFFSQESGLGFSLLRVRITPDGDTDELETAKKAVARGAKVWAAPWSPPGEWKSNGSEINGGSLLPDYYDDWAERLADFAMTMADEGVPLAFLSAQNEPNWSAEWETCIWSPSELTTFIRDHLGPALEARGVDTRVIAPEANNWGTIAEYADPLLDDAAARPYVGAIATHSYGGSAFAYATPGDKGLEFWQTEFTDEGPVDREMGSGMNVAYAIHDHLTVASVSAWHYWWLIPTGADSNSALYIDGKMTRRGYVLGNWSRFVRAGFVRVDVTSSPQQGVLVSAFRDPEGSRFAVVAINGDIDARPQTFVFAGGGAAPSVVPWVTTATQALEAQDAVSVADGAFTYNLAPASVTTFVGDLGPDEGGPPSLGQGGAAGAGGTGTGTTGGSAGVGGTSGAGEPDATGGAAEGGSSSQ